MSHIRITMKTGEVHDFRHEGRAGGSYTKSVRYDGAFAIVEDEWGKRTAFPAADIREIVEEPHRGGW
jgi:hypothetical protein